MERLQMTLGDDHQARSPFCAADKVEYVKIPYAGGDSAIGVRPAE